MPKPPYLFRVAVGFDQFVNAVFDGSPTETLSARCWRKRAVQPWKALRIVVDVVFFWQRDDDLGGHCQQSYDKILAGNYLPPEYRQEKTEIV